MNDAQPDRIRPAEMARVAGPDESLYLVTYRIDRGDRIESVSEQAAVTFDSQTVSVEPRAAVSISAVPVGFGALRICGWCKRVAIAGHWVEIEIAVTRLDILAGQRLSGLTHGMCPDCFARIAAETSADDRSIER